MANSSSTSLDKQWAKKYILDPLTAPEPSQETGPGSTFNSVLDRAPSIKRDAKRDDRKLRKSQSPYQSPPVTSSPTASQFHSSNPFSPTSRHASLSLETQDRGHRHWSSHGSRPPVSRSNSVNHSPRLPDFFPPSTGLGRSQSVRQPTRASSSSAGGGHVRSSSATFDKGKGLNRSGSLSSRFPGDMSHRPLDMIRRDVRAADRAPHLRRKGLPNTDTIDGLDSSAIGGTYHHGGPYDATLATRNINKMYSPVEAVKESNMEALRATPREFIQDSLEKHVPLQGTAVVPPGSTDMSGNVMKYEEGADLMREPDAPGGAYKRWDFIPYHPNDLKGKGEPSYTIERDLKESKARMRQHTSSHSSRGAGEYEMLAQQTPRSGSTRKDHGAQVRQRSISAAGDHRPSPRSPGPTSPMSPMSPTGDGVGVISTNNDIRRSNTTGRRITEGLKRRFGSLRRKKNSEEVA